MGFVVLTVLILMFLATSGWLCEWLCCAVSRWVESGKWKKLEMSKCSFLAVSPF